MVPGCQQTGTLTASRSHPPFPQPYLHVGHFTSGQQKQMLQISRNKKDATNNKNARVPGLHEASKILFSFSLVFEMSNSFSKVFLLWRISDILAHCSSWPRVIGSTLFFLLKEIITDIQKRETLSLKAAVL